MKLKLRGNIWYIEFYNSYKKYKDYKSTHCRNTPEGKKAAKQELEKFRREKKSIFNYAGQPSSFMRFSDAFKRFIELQRYKAATISNKNLAKELLISVIGDKAISDYSSEDFLYFNKHIDYSKATKKILSDNTKAIRTKDLSAIFNFFVARGWIKINPVIIIREKKSKPKIIDTQDITELLSYIKNDRNNINCFNIIYFMLLTGWRAEEAVQISWEKISLNPNSPYIVSINKVTGDEEITPLLDQAYKHLLSLNPNRDKTGKIFTYKNKNGLRATYYKYQIKKFGYKKFTLHQLRKTFTTQLLRAGLDISDVKDLTRHNSVSVIMDHYREVQKELTKKIADERIKGKEIFNIQV